MLQPGEDFVANWRPSDELMMSLEGATGPRNTVGWDGDGLEVTSHPVDLIPTDVRDSTPDHVTSSGRIRINTGQGEHRDINVGNIQQRAEQRTINPLVMSTRQIAKMAKSEDQPQPSTTAADIHLEEFGRYPDDPDGPGNDRQEEKAEKSRFFLPKCLLLVVALMIIIAGIVAVIVQFKEDKPEGQRGHIVPNPITDVECPSRSFSLGEELNFTCTFDVTHKYREQLKETQRVRMEHSQNSGFNNGKNLTLDIIRSSNKTHYTYSFTILRLNATCGSAGSYDVMFYGEGEKILHNASVNFTIKPSQLKTTFKQRQLNDTECTKSVFDATCEIQNDCNNYHTTFFRNKYGTDESLNHYLSCKRNYTDAAGYDVNCSASLPENLVENFVFLGCRMKTILRETNRTFQLEKPFLLPTCELRENCFSFIPSNPIPFNCSEKSRHIRLLNNASCDFEVLTSCFSAGREIFTYRKNSQNNLTCSEQDTIPVCRLSWCRSYNYIFKNEIPGNAICRQQYEEPYFIKTTTEPPQDF